MAKRKGLEEGPEALVPAIEVDDKDLHIAMQIYRANGDMIKSLEQDQDKLKIDIEARLMIHRTKAVRHNGLIAVQCDGTSPKKLDAKRLLMAGVEAETIAACTIPGNSYTYIQVRREKE